MEKYKRFTQRYYFLIFTCLICLFSGCNNDSEDPTPNNGNPTNGNPDNTTSYNHDLGVGQAANDYLASETYTSLSVEIIYVSGFKPSQQAVSYLETMLTNRLNKPDGISITYKEISSPGFDIYSINQIDSIENEVRTVYTSNTTMSASVIFIDGNYSENTDSGKVLGVAYRNTSMVIFKETIDNNTGGIGQPSTSLITGAVLNHEFGHVMGLVNNGTPMQSDHHDAANGAHCTDENCLMYWQINSSSGLSNLLGMSSPPTFNSFCTADLQANGGK